MDDETGVPNCHCDEFATERQVQKQNANHGRFFWCCARRQDEGQCKFFRWVDGEGDKRPQAQKKTTTNVGEKRKRDDWQEKIADGIEQLTNVMVETQKDLAKIAEEVAGIKR